MEPNNVREKKKIILRFVDYLALLVDGFGCGYARFKGAVHTFSEHQKNRETVDKSMRKLIFCARPWEILGKYMDFE